MGHAYEKTLFESGPPPESVPQMCGTCGVQTLGCDEALRIRGWLVYDGVSMTSHPLHVRVCPTCQRPSETASRPEAPQQDRLL